MKRFMAVMAAALFGVAVLTSCSSNAANNDLDTSPETSVTVGSDVAEPTIMTSGNEPNWLVVEGGKYDGSDGTEFKGSVYCPGDEVNPEGSKPAYLDETVSVEPVDGDLIYSFSGQVPPGIIMPYDGSWVVAIFDDPDATKYRIKAEVVNPDYIEMYLDDPTSVTTCW